MRYQHIIEAYLTRNDRGRLSDLLKAIGIKEEGATKYLDKADQSGHCRITLTPRGADVLASRKDKLVNDFGSWFGMGIRTTSKGDVFHIWMRRILDVSAPGLTVWGESSQVKDPEPPVDLPPMNGHTPWLNWPHEDRPHITCHETGGALWIDMFEVPEKVRGHGIGAKYYKHFEAKLPAGTVLKLMAADAGSGPSTGFWKKMGFKVEGRGKQGTIMTKSLP